MIYQVIAMHDIKARAFLLPVFVPHIDVGVRAIAHAANNSPGHQLHDFPQDFTIYHLGTWDDTSAKFSPFDQPVSLGLVSNLKAVQPPSRNIVLGDAVNGALNQERN